MSSTQLDPEIAAQLDKVSLLNLPELSIEKLDKLRTLSLPSELTNDVERTDHIVHETPRLKVRIHQRKGSSRTDRPCVYSIHGGGYIMGSIDLDDGLFDKLCQETDCVGVSVDYRLAPENPYPIPIEDCYSGLAWVFSNSEFLGIDSKRIGIHGVSAGGGLAAALALMIRNRGEYQVAYQLLDCPMLDDRQITASSQAENLVGWKKEFNSFGWRSYLGDLYSHDDIPYLAAPARAKDLSGLPPAYICVGGADGFRDESIAYAKLLGECGTQCELHVYPGAPHGVMIFTDTDVGARYVRDKEHWLTRKVETAKVVS